jgi:hypothetical protein
VFVYGEGVKPETCKCIAVDSVMGRHERSTEGWRDGGSQSTAVDTAWTLTKWHPHPFPCPGQSHKVEGGGEGVELWIVMARLCWLAAMSEAGTECQFRCKIQATNQ